MIELNVSQCMLRIGSSLYGNLRCLAVHHGLTLFSA